MFGVDDGRRGSGRSVGDGLHDEAFLLECGRIIFADFWRCSVCYFATADAWMALKMAPRLKEARWVERGWRSSVGMGRGIGVIMDEDDH